MTTTNEREHTMSLRSIRRVGLALTAAATLTVGLLPTLNATAAPTIATADAAAGDARAGLPCSVETRAGYSRCMSSFRGGNAEGAKGRPAGLSPADLRSAYKFPATGARSTIAVVIAFDVPHAEQDLAVYRKTMGLPPCTSANGCFTKLNQRGQKGNYPQPDGGWALEGSMDLDMVSAACPTCKILLVEADDNYNTNLAEATRTAWRKGATVISHSYGGVETGYLWADRDAYERPGVTSVASSGDFGFQAASTPAAYRKVVAVGGTSLTRTGGAGRGWRESVWGGSGSGCSAYVAKSPWQRDTHCQMRTVSDVSAVADPETGIAVYDSYPNPFGLPTGWIVGGGTSASAPIIAGLIGLAGNGATYSAAQAYRTKGAFFDVVEGSNGFCGGDYLCNGKKGYDAPTGVGSPNGLRGL